jgi:dihydroorotase
VDGTIDAIVTDHAPHTLEEKSRDLVEAPSGMIGLETSLALSLTQLYHTGEVSLSDLIRLMSSKPSRILNLPKGRIAPGDDADLVIFDANETWIVNPDLFKSKARNTPRVRRCADGEIFIDEIKNCI